MKSLYGLLGEKLSHSFSPQIHSFIFDETKIDGSYHLFEVSGNELKEAIKGLKVLGIKGVNVTIPHKIDAMKYLDIISDEAKKIKAINTICFKGNKTIGYNTDYYGFGMMLYKYNIDVKNKRIVILGTGGASRAVVQYLLDKGSKEIIFITRNLKKAQKKLSGYKILTYNDLEHLKEKDILINCTPCGMYPNVEDCPVDKQVVSKFKVAIDLIYNPEKTLLLKYSKELNLKSINGLYMLVAQAIKSEELWNNIDIESDVVNEIYDRVYSLLYGGKSI
ncbi:MAG: shikimate dehydrogenase [Firmicutes bacterium]|nr:shikimate dehydrogenase [Bacillota bacterium]